MSERPAILIIEDILERIDNILMFTKDMSLDVYKSDLKTKNAVERNLEIIGEAANRLPNNFILEHNEIEWHKIISLRNRLIHAYFNIQDDIIWNVIINYLPNLKIKLEELKKRLE